MASHRKCRVAGWLTTAILLVVGLFVLSLFLGKYPLRMGDLLAGDIQARRVFFTLRLPRTLTALAGGFGLGAAGWVYQMVFRNPLAAPDVVGVSSGASAGAAAAILFLSAAPALVTAGAFLGGLLAVLLALGLSALAPGKGHGTVVLAGVAVHSLAQTVLMFLKLAADPEKELASIEYWIMGSLNAVTLSRIGVPLLVGGAGLWILFLLSRQIQLLSVEEEEARLLGVPVGRLRLFVLLAATLVVTSVVSVTGLISFVGLLAPHTARLLIRENGRAAMWLGGFVGSILLCGADMVARSAASAELPVSIFTSLLGAPFLIYLMMKKEEGGRGSCRRQRKSTRRKVT